MLRILSFNVLDMKKPLEHGILWMAIGLLIWWGGLNQPGWPRDGDALLHGYRALEMARMWQAGILYPRWAPDLAGGAGYPLFIFHAPLFPWIVASLSLGLGLSIEQAMKLTLMIATLGGSSGVYLLARRWKLSQPAAMTAGLAFAYMPFQLQQTNYPQYLAITIMPWLWLGIDQVLRCGKFYARWLLAVAVALLSLSHNLSALMGYLLAFGYFSLLVLAKRSHRQHWKEALMAFVIGLGMALPYLGPSILESSMVHLERASAGVYEVTRHFLNLPQLISMPPLRDDRWGNRPLILTIGLHQVLLALPSLIYICPVRRKIRRIEALWGWAVGLALIFLMLPVSQSLWMSLPFLRYFQFPWRWLGPLGLIVAILIGLSVETVRPAYRWPAAFATSIILILSVLGLIYDGGSRASLAQATIQSLHRYEREQAYPGLTATGELFPKWVEGWPELPADLLRAYEQGEEPSRLDWSTLPPEADVRTLLQRPLDQGWEIRTGHSIPIRFWVMGYPGWLVTVDGKPAPMWIEARTGWLWAEIPAGVHHVRLRFLGRWLWYLFDGIALGLWLGWPLWGVFRQQRRRSFLPSRRGEITWPKDEPHQGFAWSLLMFLLVIGLQLPYRLWAITRVPLDRPPGADRSIQTDFENRIRLVGYQIDRWIVAPGGFVRLTLWWRALRELNEDAHVYVHGIPADRPFPAHQAFQSDHTHPGNIPTRRWDPEKHYRDEHILFIPSDIQPGPYRIRVGLYGGSANRRWQTGNSQGDGVDLPYLIIIPRPIPPLSSAVSFGELIRLNGMEWLAAVPAGHPFELWLDWQILRPSDKNYTLFVHLWNEAGQLVAQRDLFQLTSMWPEGANVPLKVDFPPLPPGRYRVRMGWYLWPSMEHLPVQTPSGITREWEYPSTLYVYP